MDETEHYSGESETESDIYFEVSCYIRKWTCNICDNLQDFTTANDIHMKFIETNSHEMEINETVYVICKNGEHCVHKLCLPEDGELSCERCAQNL